MLEHKPDGLESAIPSVRQEILRDVLPVGLANRCVQFDVGQALGFEHAAEQVEQRALARTRAALDGGYAAAANVEAIDLDPGGSAKRLSDRRQMENRRPRPAKGLGFSRHIAQAQQ